MPSEGYELNEVKVVDTDNEVVDITKDGTDDNKYTFVMPEKDVTVSATFKEKIGPSQEKCIIQFNTNGADEISSIEVPAYTEIELPLIRKSGYILKGWSKASENNSVLYIDRTVMVTTSDTLHAQWKKKSSSDSSSSNGSSSSTPSTSSSTEAKTEAPKADPVIIDGKKYEIGTQKVDGNKTTFTVDQTQFASNIEKATAGSETVIPVTTSTDAIKVEFNLLFIHTRRTKKFM